MKMGSLISTSSSSSKGNSNAQITDSSTWYPQPGQHISILTFRELNHRPTSSPTSIRTEIPSNGENSRSTAEVLEAVAKQLTTLPQKP
ncbi:AC4 protein [Sida micrantha mosaic virus - Rhombifolia [Bolivia:Cerro Fraile 2:2007]]|uniref:AC4 protein n=1 Tax=Sida micrantha mosaic virus - Rhombifolia [Bolivia:Cerro Fraile 2:2007] TaxID=932068 RepID=E7CT18_9GEMI|nr:AC4 protein [Sida micrantha mosaic virus - Rhombifolia [Bolivia:Cerro Fraile 2:2007]]